MTKTLGMKKKGCYKSQIKWKKKGRNRGKNTPSHRKTWKTERGFIGIGRGGGKWNHWGRAGSRKRQDPWLTAPKKKVGNRGFF